MAKIKTIRDADALLLFKVGPVYCCAPTLPVVSVQMPPKLHHPPGSNATERGMFKSPSGMVRVVDLRKRFGVDADDWQHPGRVVVVEVEGGLAGFWVDEIVDVIQSPSKGWGKVPSLVPKNVFTRTLMYDDHIQLYADFDKLNKFRETGYLRQHIQHMKEQQQTRARNTESKRPFTDEVRNLSSDKTGSAAVAGGGATSSEPQGTKPTAPSPSLNIAPAASLPDDNHGTEQTSDTTRSRRDTPIVAGRPSRETRPVSTPKAPTGKSQPPRHERGTTAGSNAAGLNASAGLDISRSSETSTAKTASAKASERPPPENRLRHRTPVARPSPTPVITPIPASTVPHAGHGVADATPKPQSGAHAYRWLSLVVVGLLLLGGGYFLQPWLFDEPTSVVVSLPEDTRMRPVMDAPDDASSPVADRYDDAVVPDVESNTQSQAAISSVMPVESVAVEQKASVDTDPETEVFMDSERVDTQDDLAGEPVSAVQNTVVETAQPSSFSAQIDNDDEGLVIVLKQPPNEDDAVLVQHGASRDETVSADKVVALGVDTVNTVDPEPTLQVTTQPDSQVSQTISAPEPDTVKATASSSAGRPESNMVVHVVVKGDTLWHIAKRYINNPYRYPELARISKIKNPDLIYPGDKVKIIVRRQ